jgi:parvulin-like peptidyl-prolyl isomerase
MKNLARDPLFLFIVIGIVLFAGYTWLQGDTETEAAPDEIRLTLADLSQLSLQFEAQWRRQPTRDEFHRLVQDRIREEILYREALALGLDQDDTIVRRRMAQKMQFLAEDMAAAREPTNEELRAWFDANAARFAYPPIVDFRHLYFSPELRGEQALADAVAALGLLSEEPRDTKLAQSMGDQFMFMDAYAGTTPNQLAREFGPEFALEVLELEPGAWSGPVQSGFGWHIVFVDQLVPGRIPAIGDVEQEVKTAWLDEQKDKAWREAYEEMRTRYTVMLPMPPQEEGADEGESAANAPAAGKQTAQ